MADSKRAGATDVPSGVAEAALARREVRADAPAAPAWVHRFVWQSLWKLVVVGAVAAVGVVVILSLRHLLGILVVSLFFALAIIPAIEALTSRFHIRRGAAVGIIFLAALVAMILLVVFLIPGIVQFAETVGTRVGDWISQLNAAVDAELVAPGAAEEAVSPILNAASQWGDNVLGALSSGLGLVFDVFTVLTFTFYFAADFPRLMRAIMRRMPPERQAVASWVARTSIEQTGGYFYSRVLLMLICGTGAFFTMLIAGLPLVYALPMALFMGFVSEFIPFIGTYLGAIIPSLVMLAVEGWVPTLILLGYVLIYQQIENYVLNPRLSSKTMELNGAVAFGGAMAGGAIAGPMGAFMALPVAALITAIGKNTGRTYEVLEDTDGDGLPDGSGPTDGAPAATRAPAPQD
ncbi:AI-2E family transporter [Demequina activiva]|uniref:AI-2E family transporter n=1 Tax=Demequina activiva TaxID=1582364 RepID=A0A919UFQ3_9MICO|nr:AI-2E family transporter [Demequina activiva]GIG53679.1 AI-2E family transporter [Demequina activiva]